MERKILLVFINARSNTYWKQLAGIFKFLGKRPGWIPKLVSLPDEYTPELIASAEREGYDAIVVNSAGSEATARALAKSRIPLAVLGVRDTKILRRRHAVVYTRHDNSASGALAARRFLSLGQFASFCYIHPRDAPQWSRHRASGFVREIKLSGNRPSIVVTTLTDDSRDLVSTLEKQPRPMAILAANDFSALEVIQICNARGIAIPAEASVIGVGDDESICEQTSPPLTSIRFNFSEDSYRALLELERMLTDRSGRRKPRTLVCSPDRVIDRESVAAITSALSVFRRATEYIRHNAKNGIGVKDVAAALGVSQSLLSLRFREIAKQTVWETITSTRLTTVKHLLRTTSRSIYDITRQSGFNDANNLKRLFRTRFGMSMSEWRKSEKGDRPASFPHPLLHQRTLRALRKPVTVTRPDG